MQVNMQFSPKTLSQIDALQAWGYASNRSEITRRAIADAYDLEAAKRQAAMAVITLSKIEIAEAILDGDRIDGAAYWMEADGGYRLHFINTNTRDRLPWGDNPAIRLPALNPDGSGELSELAEERIRDLGLMADYKAADEAAEYGISHVEFMAAREPEDWLAAVENSLEWKLDCFIEACNGETNDEFPDAPWGRERTESGEDGWQIFPPARFEWDDSQPRLKLDGSEFSIASH